MLEGDFQLQYNIYSICEKNKSILVELIAEHKHYGRGIIYLKDLIHWIREICGADV